MATIRTPETGAPILQFCNFSKDKSIHAFFPTYAHLLIFAACFGFSIDQFDDGTKTLKHDPDPIGMEIFKNQNLFDPILVLGLAKAESYEIVEDEDQLARIIEGYASAGFRHLTKILDEHTEHSFMDYLIKQSLAQKLEKSEGKNDS